MVVSSAKKKTKAAALDVPQSIDEANALLAEYGELFNEAAHIEADMNAALAKAKSDAEEQAKPVAERMLQVFDALNAYAGAHRKDLTQDGKTKTVKLPAGEIGWRMNPPSVKWKSGFNGEKIVAGIKALIDDVVIKTLQDAERLGSLRGFIRTKEEPNKDAMGDNPDLAREIPGVKIGSSGEQFFLAPFGAELAGGK